MIKQQGCPPRPSPRRMNNDAANNRKVATVRQKLKHLKKNYKITFFFLAWETQTKTLSFTLDELCRVMSIAGIFSAVLPSTSFSITGPGRYPPILILIVSSLQLGAESRMALHDVLGRLGTAEGWQRRLSFWAESCAQSQSFHSEVQA